MKTVVRYHPVLMALHWLLAIMIIAALCVGYFELEDTPNSDPHKLDMLQLHMAGGMAILALTIVRIIVRWRTVKPAPARTGHAWLDRLAPAAHIGFYLVVVAMVATGYSTGILAGLPAIVFARSGDPLPASFAAYPTWSAHVALAAVLTTLIAVHIAAVIYHHLVKKDGLLRRMLPGSRY